MTRLLMWLSLILSPGWLAALPAEHNDDRNITIRKSERAFRFETGNAANPVWVREESRRIYACNDYRTEIPVVEFYNDMVRVDGIQILVNNSKKHGIAPRHEFYNADGIFHSDARVCYFRLPLIKQGSTSEVLIKKTVLDPLYFTRIYLAEPLFIEDQEVTLTIPSWVKVEIREFNFDGYDVDKQVSAKADATVYTFRMKNVAAVKDEAFAPGTGHHIPHLLIMSKSAQTANQQHTYFNSTKDQYDWYRKLILEMDNDAGLVAQTTRDIVKGIGNDKDRVRAVFQWVQNNIRYIAFEDGIMGFKPENAQEVLRKKYGDCKGMANLLTEMLRSMGLDARRAWIGTNHLPYDYSTPSLAVDNHMICLWVDEGELVYLDATEKHIGPGEIAERIQGRQTLIEDGNNYLLKTVPIMSHTQNTALETRKLILDGEVLKGRVEQIWKGENKDWLLFRLSDIGKDKHETALKQFLSGGSTNYEISNLEILNLDDQSADLIVRYDVVWKNALTRFGKELYVELDNRKHFQSMVIKEDKRKLPYQFPFKNHIHVETFIDLPPALRPQSLPAPVMVEAPGYRFSASVHMNEGRISYRNEILLRETRLDPPQFTQWNDAIKQLNHFYSQQLILETRLP